MRAISSARSSPPGTPESSSIFFSSSRSGFSKSSSSTAMIASQTQRLTTCQAIAGDRSREETASGARMEIAIDATQPLAIDVGVDLRGGDVGMTEHHLHGPQVRAALQQ